MRTSITKEELATLPIREFDGHPVTVINMEQAEIATRQIREGKCPVGFDTETRPSFRKGEYHKVALVQLSIGKFCFLFRLSKIKCMPACLKELLEDPNIVKVGLSTKDDFRNLNKWESIAPKGFIELQEFVKDYGITDMSLAKIYADVFEKKLSKKQQMTNWEADQLSFPQQTYASLDAISCVEIYEELTKHGVKVQQNNNQGTPEKSKE